MRIYVLTLFPQMFQSPLASGIFKRAADRGMVEVVVRNIRDHTHDRHHTADDYPYGGGAGMVLKPEPVFEAVESIMTTRRRNRNAAGYSADSSGAALFPANRR